MAKYKVVRPIEHNNKLYLPAGGATTGTAKSASHGGDIPVDNSGIIDLTEQEAEKFKNGQVEPVARGGSPPTKGGTGKGAQADPGPADFVPTPIKQIETKPADFVPTPIKQIDPGPADFVPTPIKQ
jgi:hypothetical protein